MKLRVKIIVAAGVGLIAVSAITAIVFNTSLLKKSGSKDTTQSKSVNQGLGLTQVLTMFNSKIVLKLPNNWTITHPTGHCMTPLSSGEITCLEEVFAIPPNRPNYLVQISAFRNPAHLAAKDWLDKSFGLAAEQPADNETELVINGQTGYYRHHGTAQSKELTYVVASKDLVVLTKALVGDQVDPPNTPPKNDRQTEATIFKIVQTTHFK